MAGRTQILASTIALPLQLLDIFTLAFTFISTRSPNRSYHQFSPGIPIPATVDLWTVPPHPGPESGPNPSNISGPAPGVSIADGRSANVMRVGRPAERVVVAMSLANGVSRLRFEPSMLNA